MMTEILACQLKIKPSNTCTPQVLGLVHYLVKFGYYGDTKDIKLLLQPLLNLLDGRNDKPYPKSKSKIPFMYEYGALKNQTTKGRFYL